MQRNQKNYETIPNGTLGLIAMDSCRELGENVNTNMKMILLFVDIREILIC